MSEMNKKLKDLILKNLGQNGFPLKKVSLPLEKLYEAADERGANLNQILEILDQEGTTHEKVEDKIIFSAKIPEGVDQEAMMNQAQEMMSQMTPEQITEIQNMIGNMSPEEREQMMKQASTMFSKK